MGKTILVSGASGLVGYGILKSLRQSHEDYKLIGTTIYENSVAPLFCDVVEKILPTDDENYIDNLNSIIHKHNVDMIIPSIECDLYRWNKERANILTFPLLNNSDLIDMCQDKWVFYLQLFRDNPEYAIPTSLTNMFCCPYILKPRHGFGSKGIIKVYDNGTYYKSDYIFQPIIGSDEEEYTVSGFFDYDSRLVDYFPLRRKLVNGSTGEAVVEDRGFGVILADLAKTFKPIGPTNFQFRFDGEQAKLLEINPRISSATSIRAAMGYNEGEMSVEYFLDGKLPKIKGKPIGLKAIRYTEDYIF